MIHGELTAQACCAVLARWEIALLWGTWAGEGGKHTRKMAPLPPLGDGEEGACFLTLLPSLLTAGQHFALTPTIFPVALVALLPGAWGLLGPAWGSLRCPCSRTAAKPGNLHPLQAAMLLWVLVHGPGSTRKCCLEFCWKFKGWVEAFWSSCHWGTCVCR